MRISDWSTDVCSPDLSKGRGACQEGTGQEGRSRPRQEGRRKARRGEKGCPGKGRGRKGRARQKGSGQEGCGEEISFGCRSPERPGGGCYARPFCLERRALNLTHTVPDRKRAV